jgi:ADP-ribosylglycohydrolase
LNKSIKEQYGSQIYAGVLGKIIGVYLGRPVEGWAYDRIEKEFGEVDYFVHDKLGLPLIVADDDISGTFGFFRTMEDNDFRKDISSKDIGDTWLNYIIEDKTILWWGGLGRSTEHTAYLRLKNGIHAPKSGSIELNGITLAEQIGAQIFIDAFAMMCPNDPEKAINYIRKAAQVSHDGLAVDAACFLGALESLAFTEKKIDLLLDKSLNYVSNPRLIKIVGDIRNICANKTDWREAREAIDALYGYDKYDGPCHIVPNHSIVLASLILGGNDFHRSVMIASSAAWDTDCNAGNIGCLNGIRLGLNALNEKVDLRTPIADKMLVVTSDSGACISDAVIETRKIIRAAAALNNEDLTDQSEKRFTFEYPGSLQGFSICPYSDVLVQDIQLTNPSELDEKRGLTVHLNNCSKKVPADISTPTFVDQKELIQNFSTISSPTLYSGQNVEAVLSTELENIYVEPYVLVYELDNNITKLTGSAFPLHSERSILQFTVPDTQGMPVFRLGFSFYSDRNVNGKILIESIDWEGAPKEFGQRGVLMKSIWDVNPYWLQVWASSAKQFAPDFTYTYCISHPENYGIVTQGTREWKNYSIESNLMFNLHKQAGFVIRSNGHHRYYAALFSGGNQVSIIFRKNQDENILAKEEFKYEQDHLYNVKFRASENELTLFINGKKILSTRDNSYSCGAAGYRVDAGTMLVENYIIRSC